MLVEVELKVLEVELVVESVLDVLLVVDSVDDVLDVLKVLDVLDVVLKVLDVDVLVEVVEVLVDVLDVDVLVVVELVEVLVDVVLVLVDVVLVLVLVDEVVEVVVRSGAGPKYPETTKLCVVTVVEENSSAKSELSFKGVTKCIGTLLVAPPPTLSKYVGGIMYADDAPFTSRKYMFPAVAPFVKTTSVKNKAHPAPGEAITSKSVCAAEKLPLYFTA